MVTATKTINPLPFEHLEPRRFEDLVRQLAYDFRRWRMLEATGRSGADDSFDIRGWEITNAEENADTPDPDDPEAEQPIQDRLWLIQCKREKEIGPTKMRSYVAAIPKGEQPIYGVIIAAACNFSLTTRTVFYEECRKAGFSECYLWSRGEIEDKLFQPQNDHLLFAYFNISLTMRRRSVATNLRFKLSIKRKIHKVFGKDRHVQKAALFLDPREEKYPNYDTSIKYSDLPWKVLLVAELHPRGIIIQAKRYPAYLAEDRVHWDVADAAPEDTQIHLNPWATSEDVEAHHLNRQEIFDLEEKWPTQCRAHITVQALIRFEDIIDIDDQGDTLFEGPIIYTEIENGRVKFFGLEAFLRSAPTYTVRADGIQSQEHAPQNIHLEDNTTNRISVFPHRFRKA